MAWIAQSFLAVSPLSNSPPEVLPLAGFSWGFTINESLDVEPIAIQPLQMVEWDGRLPHLKSTYPTWLFHSATSQ
jgi:hypothetical protein